MIKRIAILAGGLSLAACSATGSGGNDDPRILPEPTGQCAAEAYQVLIGQQIGEVHTDSLPRPHRVYSVFDMITQDYRPDRLNVVVGEDGAVVEVRCG
jgi:hypothetical protein